jgi:uncharacterized protein YbbC (DUF1343 family)
LILNSKKNILFGIDNFLQCDSYKDKRIAFVCNEASLTKDGVQSRLALLKNGFKIIKLFSPEHGLNASGEDGYYQPDGIDILTGLPIVSLYGDRLTPGQEDLAGIDMVLFDLPDVGCRFYTYLWTMTYLMEACAVFNIPFFIADRPNPIGGKLFQAEGPMLDEASCSSFIGRWNIPLRHSCTLGELAQYFKATKIPALQLVIMPVSNWQREITATDDFTPTSPAISKLTTALLYPGTGLLEGINVNEGRGTEYSFEVCATPWINKEELFDNFKPVNHPGLQIETMSYVSRNGLYLNDACHGIKISVINENIVRPVAMVISLIKTLMNLYPDKILERLYKTVANPDGKGHLDKLLGIPGAFNRLKIEKKINTDIATEWTKTISDFLIYR